MKPIIASVILLSAFTFRANAQNNKNQPDKQTAPVSATGWYMSINSGYNIFIGENNKFYEPPSSLSFKNNCSPSATIYVGYDATQVIGFREGFGWAQYRWTPPHKKTLHSSGVNLTTDLTINLSNWWAGTKTRSLAILAFVGLGAGYRFKGDYSVGRFTPIARFGMQGNIRLSRILDLNIELANNLMSDRMNEITDDTPFSDVTSLQLGLTYHFRAKRP
jgi:hypothetical protein